MTQPQIRRLERNDEAEWRRLFTAYLAFYETSVTDDVYTTTFARLLADDPNEFHGLVVDTGVKLAGLVHFLFHRDTWTVANTCYLEDLYVDPPLRGTGLGRALIEAVYEQADLAGAAGVYWMTQEFNATGRRLYDRIGNLTAFVQYER
ncbi:MAG: GNAT family N-acetyltransferase [Acidimicrobiia bacterium]|nr:GNAT family N-acetyltransferase [Acidimicrobiia bacterium]MDH5503584.1 GNAT family N-acetyltransferase [Acidimicrobiia bacterium]